MNKDNWSNIQVALPPPEVGEWNNVEYHLEYTSDRTGGGVVGTIAVMWWTGSAWENMHAPVWFTPDAPIGVENIKDLKPAWIDHGDTDTVYVQVLGWPFQGETEPYPLMIRQIGVTFIQE